MRLRQAIIGALVEAPGPVLGPDLESAVRRILGERFNLASFMNTRAAMRRAGTLIATPAPIGSATTRKMWRLGETPTSDRRDFVRGIWLSDADGRDLFVVLASDVEALGIRVVPSVAEAERP